MGLFLGDGVWAPTLQDQFNLKLNPWNDPEPEDEVGEVFAASDQSDTDSDSDSGFSEPIGEDGSSTQRNTLLQTIVLPKENDSYEYHRRKEAMKKREEQQAQSETFKLLIDGDALDVIIMLVQSFEPEYTDDQIVDAFLDVNLKHYNNLGISALIRDVLEKLHDIHDLTVYERTLRQLDEDDDEAVVVSPALTRTNSIIWSIDDDDLSSLDLDSNVSVSSLESSPSEIEFVPDGRERGKLIKKVHFSFVFLHGVRFLL